MFRLIVALGIATVLLPAETFTSDESTHPQTKQAENTDVSAFDALYAVQSLYTDITSFCDRNSETCDTGRNIATNTVDNIRSTINAAGSNDQTTLDKQIKTGSVEK